MWKHRITVRPRKFGVTRLTLDEAYVTPPKKVLDRIARERVLTAAAKARRIAELFGASFDRALVDQPEEIARAAGVPLSTI